MRIYAETTGWIVFAFVGLWLFMLTIDIIFIVIAKWRGFINIGRLAIYFAAAGSLGTTTSFTTYGGKRYDLLFWYLYWQRK